MVANRIREENQRFMQQQQQAREQSDFQRTMLGDYLGRQRDTANFERSRAATLADTESKRKTDAQQAAALAQAGGLPVEQAMPEGVQGPGPIMDYGQVGTEGVGRLLADRRMRDQNAAMMQERAIDNERADKRLALDEQKIEASLRRNGGTTPEGRAQMIPQLMAEYGFSEEEAARKIDLVANKLMSSSQVMPDQFGDKMGARIANENVKRLQAKLDRYERDTAALAQHAALRGITPEQAIANLEQQIEQAMKDREAQMSGGLERSSPAKSQAPSWNDILNQHNAKRGIPPQAPATTPNDLSGMSEEDLRKIIDS